MHRSITILVHSKSMRTLQPMVIWAARSPSPEQPPHSPACDESLEPLKTQASC